MNLKTFLTLLFALISCFTFAQYKQLKITSASIEPGAVIKFEYDPSGTPLADFADITPVILMYDGEIRAVETTLTKSGGVWKGSIVTNDSAKAILLGFKKEETIDNNDEQGYYILLKSNGKPVKEAWLAQAKLNGMGGYLLKMKVSLDVTLGLYDKEFASHPGLQAKNISSYAYAIIAANKETGKATVEKMAADLAAKPNKTEQEYINLQGLYRATRDKEHFEKITEEVEKKFPQGMAVKSKRLNEMYREKDNEKRLQLFEKIRADYPPQNDVEKRDYERILAGAYAQMANTAAKARKWDDFEKYISKVTGNSTLAQAYNQAAWYLAGEGLKGKADSLEYAKQLSEKAIEHIKMQQADVSTKAPYFTAQEYQQQYEQTLGNYMDTYALILWKLNDYEKAYRTQEEAVAKMGKPEAGILECLLIYKAKVKGKASVQHDAEEMIKEGKGTAKAKEFLKEIYIEKNKSEEGYDTYLANLEAEYKARLKSELLKKMINQPAPKFVLKDLDGNEVSLDALKGKVLVLDFWATWCGPCRASFPGMKTAQEKFKNDPDVKFLFVDTREGVSPEEMKTNAASFIEKNKYDFQVLLDTDDKVVNDYSVNGIPTKVLIDGKGNIRFKIVGYSGNNDKMVEEMKIMVDAIKSES